MILIRGARQLLTWQGPIQRRGWRMTDPAMIVDGAVLVDGTQIVRVGSSRQVENVKEARNAHVIEAHGKVVIPGFIDSCTQLLSGGPLLDKESPWVWRREWLRRRETNPRQPVGYRSIRNVSPNLLRRTAARWLGVASSGGTTSLEVQSAQGLHIHTEMKALRAARALDGEPLDLLTVPLAGPSRPDEFPPPEEATDAVIDTLIPEIKRRRLSRYLAVDADPAVFGRDNLNKILAAARENNLCLKLQMTTVTEDLISLAGEVGASGIGCVTAAGPREIATLAAGDLVATVLPAVTLQQGGPFGLARELIDAGGTLALGSGFGAAGGPTINMATVLSLACTHMGLTPAEAICAATVNAAAALGRSAEVGTIEPGKQADIAIFDVADYREIPYYLGMNLCALTMKKGCVIYSAHTLGVSPAPRLLPRSAETAMGGQPLPLDPLGVGVPRQDAK